MTLRIASVLGIVCGLGGCVTSSDPGEGGFFNGVAGIAGGGYEARIDERESAVAEASARNVALTKEQQALAGRISATENDLTRARFRLLQQKNAAKNLDATTANRINAALTAEPGGRTDEARLADLQRLLGETRALSEDLARLSS